MKLMDYKVAAVTLYSLTLLHEWTCARWKNWIHLWLAL